MARPRKHPIGTTASERVAISTANLKSAGGARKTFRLSPEAHHALQLLARQNDLYETETAVIEKLLISEKERLF